MQQFIKRSIFATVISALVIPFTAGITLAGGDNGLELPTGVVEIDQRIPVSWVKVSSGYIFVVEHILGSDTFIGEDEFIKATMAVGGTSSTQAVESSFDRWEKAQSGEALRVSTPEGEHTFFGSDQNPVDFHAYEPPDITLEGLRCFAMLAEGTHHVGVDENGNIRERLETTDEADRCFATLVEDHYVESDENGNIRGGPETSQLEPTN